MEIKPQQAGAIVQLHQWATQCVATEQQPVVMIAISINALNEIQIITHVAQGAELEQVLQMLEASYKGIKEQMKKTPSGIIKQL